MILKDYLAQLNDLVKEDRRVLNAEVIAAGDDEGNSFTPVYYSPASGTFEHGEWKALEEGGKPTAVCLN